MRSMSALPPDRVRHRPLPRRAGLRRIRRLKLLTALLLMAALSVGFVLFSLVLATADVGFERERVDGLLRRQVAAGRAQVSPAAGPEPGGGGDDLGRLVTDDELMGGYPQLYVVEVPAGDRGAARVAVAPRTPFWPGLDVVGPALEATDHGTTTPYVTRGRARRIAPIDAVEPLRIMAWSVPDRAGRPGAVVVGVASLASGDRSHRRLVAFMWWSGGAVLLGGVSVAVVMARGRFWLVDRALERHEQFLHDTAHELRAPITALRAIVGAGLADDLPSRTALEQAMRVIQGTDEVIDDLMTLTRIETGRAPLAAERIRLDLLVEALASQRTDDPPVEVRARPTVVSANAELVRRAVGNLIENAVRHGRAADRTAEVVVDVGEHRVVVSDRGPGVAPQLLPHVLERVTTGRQRTGSGLGLAIAGWVARIHGGQLTAANRSDHGAEFTLELPE
jgi:two-component system OmpR family sensor kinase